MQNDNHPFQVLIAFSGGVFLAGSVIVVLWYLGL